MANIHQRTTNNPHAVDLEQVSPDGSKGDIIAHTGAKLIVIDKGDDGEVLKALASEDAGVEWNTIAASEITPGPLDLGANDLTCARVGLDDDDASHHLFLDAAGNSLTADRTLALNTGDVSRTLTMGGDVTMNQDVDTTASPTFVGGTFTAPVTGVIPTDSAHLATKEYVDTAAGFHFDFFLSDTASGIGGYFDMFDIGTGEAQSDHTIVDASGGDDQLIAAFATLSGEPGVLALQAGVFDAHYHIEKTAGTRTVTTYWELYKRILAGDEFLLMTSEVSGAITSEAELELHAVLASDVDLLTTDRLVLKVYANVGGTGSPTTVSMYQEGATGSHITIGVSSSSLSNIFIRKDGLTEDWDAGPFQIRAETFQSDIATGDPPFVVESTTEVANLNADLLDGNHAAAFAAASHNHAAGDITSGQLAGIRGGTNINMNFTGGFCLWDTINSATAVGKTGTGSVVLASSPTIVTPTITSAITMAADGTGAIHFNTSANQIVYSAIKSLMEYKAATTHAFVIGAAEKMTLTASLLDVSTPIRFRGAASAGDSGEITLGGNTLATAGTPVAVTVGIGAVKGLTPDSAEITGWLPLFDGTSLQLIALWSATPS